MHCKALAPSRTCVLRTNQIKPVLNPVPRRCPNQTFSSVNATIRTTTKASSLEASDSADAQLAAGFLPEEVIIAAALVAPVTQVRSRSPKFHNALLPDTSMFHHQQKLY